MFDDDLDEVDGPVGAASAPGYASTIGLQTMRDTAARAERTSGDLARKKGYTSDYDVTYGYGQYDPSGHQKDRLKSMTLDQIDGFQNEMRANGGNSPVGRYQINRDSLRDLRRQLRLSGKEVFSPEMQDRLADTLLRRRGYKAFVAGKLSPAQFQESLSKEWASIPRPGQDAQSRYDNGRGAKQPAGITTAEFANLADFARTSDAGH
jgi:muramidase (phage lysozyme)